MSINPTSRSYQLSRSNCVDNLKNEEQNFSFKEYCHPRNYKICYYKTTFTTNALLKETELEKLSDKERNTEGYSSVSYKVKHLNSCRFTIAKCWKPLKCPSSVNEWIKKLWYSYTMEYYKAGRI